MPSRAFALVCLFASALPSFTAAQSSDDAPADLSIELNALQNVGGACRLTFLAQNDTGQTIEKAVFETVVFDTAGGVKSLSLFDFRELPAGKPRVRQFDLPGTTCETLSQLLINGANSCVIDGADSALCDTGLSLSSRLEVELLG